MAERTVDSQEQAAAAVKALAVTVICPACGAQPGQRCRRSPKRTMESGWYHTQRVDPLIQAYAVGLAAAALLDEKEQT